MSKQTIVSTALDATQLLTRSAILERAGYKVFSATNIREVEEACSAGMSVLALILGYSIPPREKSRIYRTIERFCGKTPVIEMTTFDMPDDVQGKYYYAIEGSPADLLRKLEMILGKSANTGAA